jgi:spore coat protein U-like protein
LYLIELNKEQQMNTNSPLKQRSLKIALVASFALGAASLGGSAAAANNATATATATVVTPIAITKVTDLAFGSFYPAVSSGTVAVSTNGTRTVSGGVLAAATGATPAAAKFDITGTASATYTIAYDAAVVLTGPGTDMALTQVSDLTGGGAASSLVASGTLSAGGTQSLYIGGTLAVGANQVAGAYTANITATVNYN